MSINDVNKGTQLTSFVPGDLINQNFQYVFEVPIYQRVFTWGEVEFDRLTSDLVKAFNGGGDQNNNKYYYLGAITVVRKEREPNTLVLVDGQQRVTCIMLLGALFRWWGADKIRIKYESRPKDMECLRRIYDECVSHSSTIDTSKLENGAMRAFFDYINRSDARLKEVFLDLGDKIKEKLRLFVSYLPDNPYMSNLQAQNEYFEKMNSGGKQLEPEDILKVRICGKLGEEAFEEWNAISDFSKCYHTKYNFPSNNNSDSTNSKSCQQAPTLLELVESVDNISEPKSFGLEKNDLNEPDEGEKSIPVRQGLIDFGMFLRHVLHVLCRKVNNENKDVFSGSLLDTFAKCEDWDMGFCKRFLGEMQSYRKFLDELVIHLKDEGGGYGYYFYSKKENRDSKSLVESDCSDSILQLQSLLYVASDDKQKWLMELYNLQQQNDLLRAVKMCLFDKLKGDVCNSILSKTQAWPNVNKCKSDYGNVLKYGSSDVRLWLAFLDYLLWDLANYGSKDDYKDDYAEVFREEGDKEKFDSSTMNAIKEYVFRRNRSVEHLHPQTDSNSANQQEWAQQPWGSNGPSIKDFFGNLALISAGRNSEYGNESVGGKADRVRRLVESKRIESIKLLFMLKDCDEKDEKWNPKCALGHAKLMLKVLRGGLKRIKESFTDKAL